MSDLFETPVETLKTVSVLTPLPVDKAYDYLVPDGMDVQDGDYVVVPVGSRQVTGVVWGAGQGDVTPAKLKPILTHYDLPPMSDAQKKFIDWMAHYTMSPRGAVLKLALSVPAVLEKPKVTTGYQIVAGQDGTHLSAAGKRVLACASEGHTYTAATLAKKAGCSASVIKTLYQKGVLKPVDMIPPPPCDDPDPAFDHVSLSEAQGAAASLLKAETKPVLLDGVTGAGKTEVYFEAVAEILRRGQQALILLPEIALSNAFLKRFEKRFGCTPALWHSSVSAGRRKTVWRGVCTGETKIVIGARSALFLPYRDLGLVVVDEEHDPAYKQEDGVIYNARDMAVVRTALSKASLVLVSATPSLETMKNVWDDRYAHVTLPERHGGAVMPDVTLIDLREDKPDRQKFIAPTLHQALQDTLSRGQQSLLFLNRRGYAPLTLCRTCGHRFECPRCSAWLIEHKKTHKLHCHHCDHALPVPDVCPSCSDKNSLAPCGPGVERIFEEVKEAYPEARVCILSSDTAQTHDDLKRILQEIQDHKIDIVIGTQIIAKGHHFPKLTCVGVIDADLGLSGGDLRASERTYQLLHQVAGRAGRAQDKGHVYLQTFHPDSRVMQALAAHDRDAFLAVEAESRELAHMPPFSRLAGVIVSGRDEDQVVHVSRLLGKAAPQGERIQTLGPADAPLYRLRGQYRRRLLVNADKNIDIQKAIAGWVAQIKCPSTVRIQIDIDPQSFF